MPSLAELRHTAAHVLAYAVQDLFPEAKPTIGPAIENGFYYDFDRSDPFTPDDLGRLEARMNEIVAADYPMTGREVDAGRGPRTPSPATHIRSSWRSEIPEGEPITLYTIGEFTDLCRGGHAESTGEIGAFKLTSVAGAYWRGDEHNPMLQRIYGTAWYDASASSTAHLARSKRRSGAITASSAPSSISSPSKRTPAAASCSGIPRARSCAASSRTSFARVCATAATAGRHAARRQRTPLRDLRSPRKLRAEHVRPDRGRGSALPAQADELPRAHPHLSQPAAQLSRAAAALLRVRHRVPLRTLGRAARPDARARIHRRTTRTCSARRNNCKASSS